MIKYGSDQYTELKFTGFKADVEKRDPWIDIYLQFEVDNATPIPSDLTDISALIICNSLGTIIQFVAQDVGCDCEYEFTEAEKAQMSEFIKGIDHSIIC